MPMKKKLKDIARVLRWPARREEVGIPENPILWQRGRIPVWHEVRLENIDPYTGLILDPLLPAVKPEGEPGRYAIMPGDVLFCFQGVAGRIGEMAMMLDELAAIPGRTIGIIRAISCDPVWLFYRLREPDVKEKLTPKITGGKAFLNLSVIREMELEMPMEEEVSSIGKLHKDIVDSYRQALKHVERCQSAISEILRKKERTT